MARERVEHPDLASFAAELSRLHVAAGKPGFAELERRTGYGRTVLSQALNGRRLPSWDVIQALVRVLSGDEAAWLQRWAALTGASDDERRGRTRGGSWRSLPRWAFAVAGGVGLVIVVAALLVGVHVWQGGRPTDPDSTDGAGLCMQVVARQDVRVFKGETTLETWTVWPHGTKFWIEGERANERRYRTPLRDGKDGWVTSDQRYVVQSEGCP